LKKFSRQRAATAKTEEARSTGATAVAKSAEDAALGGLAPVLKGDL